MHLFIAGCPCAVTSNPNLLENVEYNGKCYLLYKDASQPDHYAAQTRCQNPTSPSCGVGGACTTSGVGQLATFPSYADYNSAVTTQFSYPSSSCVHLGLLCDSSNNVIIEDFWNGCDLRPPLNPPWPNPFNCPGAIYADTSWSHFEGYHPHGCANYICEVGKSLKNDFKKAILSS